MSDAPLPQAQRKLRSAEVAGVLGRFAWPLAFVAVAGMTLAFLREREAPPAPAVEVAHAGPTVVSDLRALARLETLSLHLEKVIDVKDRQRHLRGLVEADDAVLFVASGEAVLGVDLAKVREEDARFDAVTKTATITLPDPELFSTHFDERRSYVHTRSTDLLAKRNEDLEASARRSAITSFEKAALEPANVARAREHAETVLRSLGKSWGAERVVIAWRAPSASEGS